jgi:hypothetical protein
MEQQVGKEVARHSKKILLLFGGESFNKYDYGQTIRQSLTEQNIEYTELGGVQADPTADLIYQGIEICRSEQIDFILAVGGASVIDSAKAIGIGVDYEGDFFDFFQNITTPETMLKVGVVLTISGAGSESSNAAVITKDKTKYSCGSPNMFPTFAILNPQLTISVPQFLTACGIVDSISHVFERYFSNTPAVEVSDGLCESLIRTLMTTGIKTIKEPLDIESRANAMWAAKLAHDNTVGFGRKQDWATHTIAHEIGARYKQPHGAILAVIFPAWMQHVSSTNIQAFLKFAENVFNVDIKEMTQLEAIQTAIESYKLFLKEMGMPSSLRELGLTDASEFDSIAKQCSLTTMSGTIGNFVRLSQNDVVTILKSCA